MAMAYKRRALPQRAYRRNYKNTILLDTKLIYKLDKRIELSATLNNILNQRTYNYLIYNQLTSFESKRHLRGRELLITISLRK